MVTAGTTDLGAPRSETQSSHFESGKGELLPNDRKSLDRIASLVRGRANLRFMIIGHTDSQRISKPLQKTYPDNHALGFARARRVGAHLRDALGLLDSAFEYDSKGETQPLADNGTREGMAKNRRVEVQVFWNDPVSTMPVKSTVSTDVTVPAEAPAAPASECDALAPPIATDAAFAMSVDGNPVADAASQSTRRSADRQRCEDVALARDHLRLQYDNLAQTRRLNVSAWPVAVVYGAPVRFRGHVNYRPFIERAEVLITQGDVEHGFVALATLPLDKDYSATWTAPTRAAATAPDRTSETLPLWYRLRVYDAQGAFDETQALPLSLLDRAPVDEAKATKNEDEQLNAGFGENRIEIANIAVEGGTLTVSGDGIAATDRVSALGMTVPVDPNGRFVIQQIVPRGLGTAEIAVTPAQGDTRIYRRDFRLPNQDWFYIGIADLTLGHNNASSPAETVTRDAKRYDGDTFTNGRLAFYTKGKLDNATTVTAAMDTREAPIEDMFKNFGRKDPRSVFRRFDAKDSWATFGDDSTRVEDAPTQGRFYVRAERDQSSLMWGDFKVAQTETELSQINRGLYGADLRIAGADSTSFGARSFRLEAFGADPGTVAAKDEYRGTGGTLYYLRNQDVSLGSERLYVEVRDRDSGFVLSRRPLVTGSDYEMDYLQGRVLLSAPLSSYADESTLVREGGLSGNPVWIVANYEFTPVNIAGNNMMFGGRVSNWFGDSLRVGVTATSQRQQDISQKLGGIDLLWRRSEDTWLKFELANSEGFSGNQSFSNDGGYFFGDRGLANDEDTSANAGRVEAQFALRDFGNGDGKFGFYGERREAGFSGPGQVTDRESKKVGASVDLALTDTVKLNARFDTQKETHGYDDRTAAVDVALRLSEQLQLSVGLRNDKREEDSLVTPLAPTVNDVAGINAVSNAPARTGTRTDAAVQLSFASGEDWSAYGFGQGTLQRSGDRLDNNRGGIGGKLKLSERVTGDAEVSGGNGGFGAHAGVDYQFSDASNAYLSYRADPDRTDEGIRGRNGMLVGGARTRLSEIVSLNTEYRYQIGETAGLMQAYGVELTPFDKWTFGASAEVGKLDSELLSRIERHAAIVRANYTGTDVRYGGAIEFRRDESRQDTRRSWLARNNLSWQLGTDGRVLGRLNIGRSNSSAGTIFGTDYTEAMAGYAWRPANNDRWNALFRYTYLFDLTSPGQQDGLSSSLIDYQQRSHVLALDANYDISPRWTIGGRLAGRRGELRQSRDNSSPWFESTATLVALRLDFKIVHNWDWLIEGRQLRAKEARDHKSGALTALYYHVDGNLKIGAGYNWTSFSDELTDLDYRNRGLFLNVLGSF